MLAGDEPLSKARAKHWRNMLALALERSDELNTGANEMVNDRLSELPEEIRLHLLRVFALGCYRDRHLRTDAALLSGDLSERSIRSTDFSADGLSDFAAAAKRYFDLGAKRRQRVDGEWRFANLYHEMLPVLGNARNAEAFLTFVRLIHLQAGVDTKPMEQYLFEHSDYLAWCERFPGASQ